VLVLVMVLVLVLALVLVLWVLWVHAPFHLVVHVSDGSKWFESRHRRECTATVQQPDRSATRSYSNPIVQRDEGCVWAKVAVALGCLGHRFGTSCCVLAALMAVGTALLTGEGRPPCHLHTDDSGW